jgi:hypothetical protein
MLDDSKEPISDRFSEYNEPARNEDARQVFYAMPGDDDDMSLEGIIIMPY